MAFGAEHDDGEAARAVALARARGCLSVGFGGSGAEWEIEPPSRDAFVRQELVETLYHVLWELVHVFFEHRGLLRGREARRGPRRGRVELPVPVPRRAGGRARAGASKTFAARC